MVKRASVNLTGSLFALMVIKHFAEFFRCFFKFRPFCCLCKSKTFYSDDYRKLNNRFVLNEAILDVEKLIIMLKYCCRIY